MYPRGPDPRFGRGIPIDFRILGPLEAHAGRALPLGGAKQRALLALLLLRRNEAVSTDDLIDGLWGEAPPATAAKAVQVYVSRLRRLLGPAPSGHGRLCTRAPGYLLELSPGELDLQRFETLVEEAQQATAGGDPAAAADALRRGLALWRGPPLADLAFEPFAQAAAARLEEQRLAALESRVEADLAAGRAPELVGELSALVREHPYRERLRRQLVLALYRSDRQAEALEAHRAARRALMDELGIEPSAGLAELEQAILRHDPALALPAPDMWAAPPPAPVPGGAAPDGHRPSPRSLLAQDIVGREGVLERLDWLLEAGARAGQVIAIAGEAGLGKTRLATALRARAQERGRLVLMGRASPLEAALPLGVLQDALRGERRTWPGAPVPDDPLAAAFPGLLLPELGVAERAPELDGGALFEAAARYLRARAAPAGLVLVLEDLHWADPTSHALAAYLARTTRDAPILLALTYRQDEAPAGSSLDALRHELSRERLGEEVRLAPLGPEDVALMLRDILGAELDGALLAMVARASGGNPFVVEELVRDAVAQGTLDPAHGRWPLEGPIAIPGTVQEMLLRRVRALGAGDRELLRWAALLGERFDPGLLALLGERSERATLQALGRLSEAALVADGPEGGDGRLAFRHALTREAVLGELLGPERRRRHARVLEVAEALPGAASGLPLEEMLEHALGAGDRAKSLEYSVQAANRAVDLGGYQEARSQYERALALWRPDDGPATKAGLLMRLGYLTSHVGGGLLMWVRQERSRRHFDEALRLYEEIGDTPSAALALAGSVWSRQKTDVLDDLRRAREGLGPDAAPDAVCQILCRLADREFLVGYPRAALRTSAEGLALLEVQAGGGDPSQFPRRVQLRRSFRLTSAAATWWLGDHASGRATMLALTDDALAGNDHLLAALTFNYLARQSIDWPPDAWRYAQRGIELAGGHGLSSTAAWLAHLRAQAHVQQGEWEAAGALLDRAEAHLAEMPDQPFLRLALSLVRGEIALGRGRPESAVHLLEPLLPELAERQGRIHRRMVRTGLARALLAQDDPGGARAALAPLVDRWERAEEGPFALSALLPMAAVEVADALGDADEAARWSAELAALGAGPRADYARGLAELTARRPRGGPAIEDAARAVEGDRRLWEGAWMRIAGADAALRAGDADQAADLAAAALVRFRAMESEGWCRRSEGLLRRLGRGPPTSGTSRGTALG